MLKSCKKKFAPFWFLRVYYCDIVGETGQVISHPLYKKNPYLPSAYKHTLSGFLLPSKIKYVGIILLVGGFSMVVIKNE